MFGRNFLRTIPKLFTPTPKLDIRGEEVDDEAPEHETSPGFLTIGCGPGSAEIVLATDAEKPDACASHWRGYFGSYVTWGTVQGCTSTLFARAGGRLRFSGMRVITGVDAAEWMAEHGDPFRGDGG